MENHNIKRELHENEKIIHYAKPSRLNYWHYYFPGIMLCFIPPIIAEIKVMANHFYVTDKRVVQEYRFLRRQINAAKHENIQDISIHQGMIERLFGLGTICMNTSGGYGKEVVFKGVYNPYGLKRMIEEKCF